MSATPEFPPLIFAQMDPRRRNVVDGVRLWYRDDYTEAELAIWADRIGTSGTSGTWAYFNNDRDGHAIKNAQGLARVPAPPFALRSPSPAFHRAR